MLVSYIKIAEVWNNLRKMGIAELALWLQILQPIAFLKPDDEYNKKLIQLANTKIKFVVS